LIKKAEIYYSSVSYIKAVRKPESIEKLEQDTSNVTMGFPPEVYLNKDFFNGVRILKQMLFESQTIEGFNVTKL
jgi:hypothetical protein